LKCPLLLVAGLVGVVVMVLIAVIVWIGSPRGPRLQEVAHRRERHLKVLAPQKVLVVTARGDPDTVGKKAFGLLFRTPAWGRPVTPGVSWSDRRWREA